MKSHTENVDPLFSCVMPTGIWWSDRTREEAGDFKKLASLMFRSLELEVFNGCPPELEERIRNDAEKIQRRKGEKYQVSTAGQTITLGHGLAN